MGFPERWRFLSPLHPGRAEGFNLTACCNVDVIKK
jgi:hypothetical protein